MKAEHAESNARGAEACKRRALPSTTGWDRGPFASAAPGRPRAGNPAARSARRTIRPGGRISRWSRPERPKPGEVASASGSVNWSTAHSGLPCPLGGTPWVSDRIQTGVCRRRRVSGLRPHNAIEPGNIRTTNAPLSRILSMTADHHGRGTTPFVIAWEATVNDALGAKTSVANISSAEGTATTRPCPRRPRGQRRPGSAASDTGPLLSPDARPKIWRRSGRWKTRRTTRRRGTADDQLSRPRRPVYPRARFRPSSSAGAWLLNSGDSQEIPASP